MECKEKEEISRLKQEVNDWRQRFEASEKRYQTLQENFIKVINLKNSKIKDLEDELKAEKSWYDKMHKVAEEQDNAIAMINNSLNMPMKLIPNYIEWAEYTLEQIKQGRYYVTDRGILNDK